MDFRIEKVNRIPNYINAKRSSPRLILYKLSKVNGKERILKAASGGRGRL